MKLKPIVLAASLLLMSLSLHSQVLLGPWIPKVSETSFTINWESQKPGIIRLEVVEHDRTDTLFFHNTMYGRSLVGTSHSVTAEGLKPGTGYSYRVCMREVFDETQAYHLKYDDKESYSDWYDIKTLDFNARTCSFTMVNDIHDDKELIKTLVDAAPETDFLFFNGDMSSYITDINKTKDNLISPIQDRLHSTPVFYARGNHETRGKEFWRFPEIFPLYDGKAYYAFRHGPAAFIVIDCGEDKPDSHPAYSGNAHYDEYRAEEAEWIASVAKEKWFRSAPVKICVSHIPMFVEEDSWYTQKQLNSLLLPALNKAGIDLMLSAHFHKHVMTPAKHSGNDFPILINTNDERFDVRCEGTRIHVDNYNLKGELIRTFTF